MFFAPSLNSLIALCRALHHNLDAGVRIVKVFEQQAERGPRELRDVNGRLRRRLAKGNSLTAALKNERLFPPLFVSLAAVGEETGHLAEVFGALEQYYLLQQQLQRKFRSQIIGPVIQFVIAVGVIALVILILGWLNAANNTQSSVFGLSGSSGALVFLGIILGGGLAVFFLYQALSSALHGKAVIDALLLRVPVLGPCLQALALGRFTMALHLTLDSGVSIFRAVRLSLEATGNAAFVSHIDEIDRELREGESLTLALTGTGIFPDDFRNLIAIAEESGRIPEVMRKQANHYHEEAARRLKALTAAAAWGVYAVYAVFMIVMIFQLAQIYFSALKV
jgi:type IV pilus assembly protein PilC